MANKLLILSLVCVLVLSVAVLGAEKEDADKGAANLLIIIDSSRSMAKLMKDRIQRLDAVKLALGVVLENLPGSMNVGMMVFGHRGKKEYGSKDIEMVVPVVPIGVPVIKSELQKLKPNGVSPLAASLLKASKILGRFKGRSCILLMTDGNDTCGGDPVATARKIRDKYGISVVIDVVGLNVPKSMKKELAAIAEAGGGGYHPAETIGDLAEALSESISDKTGYKIDSAKIRRGIRSGRYNKKKEEEKPKIDFSGEGSGTLILYHGELSPRKIRILDQETGKEGESSYMWIHVDNSYKITLKAGVYELKMEMDEETGPLHIRNVIVRGGRETLIALE